MSNSYTTNKTTGALNVATINSGAIEKLRIGKSYKETQQKNRRRTTAQQKCVLNTIIADAKNDTVIVDNFKGGALVKIAPFSYVSAGPITSQKVKRGTRELKKLFEDIKYDIIAIDVAEIRDGLENQFKMTLFEISLQKTMPERYFELWKSHLSEYWQCYGLTRCGTILTPDIMKLLIDDTSRIYTERTQELLKKKEAPVADDQYYDDCIPF